MTMAGMGVAGTAGAAAMACVCVICLPSALLEMTTTESRGMVIARNEKRSVELFLGKYGFGFMRILHCIAPCIWTLESSLRISKSPYARQQKQFIYHIPTGSYGQRGKPK